MGVCVSLLTQHAEHMRRIILSCVASLAPPHFSTYLINARFTKKKLLNVKYVFRFSLQILSETCRILRIIQRDIVINVKTFYVKYPLFLIDFNEI
jgi:hypothetical protein